MKRNFSAAVSGHALLNCYHSSNPIIKVAHSLYVRSEFTSSGIKGIISTSCRGIPCCSYHRILNAQPCLQGIYFRAGTAKTRTMAGLRSNDMCARSWYHRHFAKNVGYTCIDMILKRTWNFNSYESARHQKVVASKKIPKHCHAPPWNGKDSVLIKLSISTPAQV